MEIKILSSIPGRIRIKIEGLKRNEKAVSFLKNCLQFYHGISFVSPSISTGNLLVLYDCKLISAAEVLEKITSTSIQNVPKCVHEEFTEVERGSKLTSKNYLPYNDRFNNKINTYEHEITLSKKLLALNVLVIVPALFTSISLGYTLGILVFGFPGVLFLIRKSAYCREKKMLSRDFNLANPSLVNRLAEIEHMLIEDSIINADLLTSIPGDISNLAESNALKLIKDFRNIGLTDIHMLSTKNSEANNHISFMLGINKIELDRQLSQDKSLIRSTFISANTAAIISSNDLSTLCSKQILVFLGGRHIRLSEEDSIITFNLNSTNKIPFVLDLSKYCKELITRSETIAITVNILGMFFAVAEFITFLPAAGLYIFNYLSNKFYISNKLTQYEKEYLNEIKYPKYNLFQ